MLNLAPLCIFALAKQQQPLFVLSPSLIDLTAENIDKIEYWLPGIFIRARETRQPVDISV